MRTRALALASLAASFALGAHGQPASVGVSPTAPQAEDRPDVGDTAGAPVPAAPPVATNAGAVWTDASDNERGEAYVDATRAYADHLLDVKEQVRELAERKYKERKAQIEANYRRQL